MRTDVAASKASPDTAKLAAGIIVSSDEPPGRPESIVADEHMERALLAHSVGIGTIAAGHRYSFAPSSSEKAQSLSTWRLQPLPLLAAVAGQLKGKANYCTSVLLSTACHPVQLAEDVATVNTLAHGNFRLGLGLGWMPFEFAAFGVEERTKARRFEDLIRAYRQLTSADEANYEGTYFSIDNAKLIAGQSRASAAPIWIGASADAAVRRAARLGDSWIMSAHMDIVTLVRQREEFLRVREEAGLARPRDLPIVRTIAIAETRREAVSGIRPTLEEWYRNKGDWGWFLTKNRDGDVHELAADRWIVGDPNDCIDQIRRLREKLQVTEIIFSMVWPGMSHQRRLQMIDLLGREVIPKI